MPDTLAAAPKERPGSLPQLLSSWWGGWGAGSRPQAPRERLQDWGDQGETANPLPSPPWALLVIGLRWGGKEGVGRRAVFCAPLFLRFLESQQLE